MMDQLVPIRFAELVATSARVRATASRRDKTAILAELFGRLGPSEIEPAVGFLIGWPRQGKVGLGWAGFRRAIGTAGDAADEPNITLIEVDESLGRLGTMAGKGSTEEKRSLLENLLRRATAPERLFLGALATGEVRQGALDAIILEAVARAAGIPSASLQRAAMLAGDLGRVAREALTEGAPALERYRIELFRPLQPMLADSAADTDDALAKLGRAVLEFKLDGARVQVHKDSDQVRIFTRNLNDVTAAVPEVVTMVRGLSARRAILDGEVIALDSRGRPRAFQITMRRFGRRLDVESLQAELPVTPFFFDALLLDDDELLDRPETERFAQLAGAVPAESLVPRLVTADLVAARDFFERSIAAGHEGVMAKDPDARYEAGRRGSAWLKVKRARTLDLVILAAEWGSGRRKGWLSNVYLGARDPAGGPFIMLGKTFKGMTDEMLRWQTARFLELEERRDGHVVYFRPEVVAEVAFDGVQASTQYPGGVALRFARIKGYRADKSAAEADTIDAVRGV